MRKSLKKGKAQLKEGSQTVPVWLPIILAARIRNQPETVWVPPHGQYDLICGDGSRR